MNGVEKPIDAPRYPVHVLHTGNLPLFELFIVVPEIHAIISQREHDKVST